MVDGDFGTPPVATSCVGLPATCGPSGNGDCCETLPVPGGTFYRLNDASLVDMTYKDTNDPATVSSFYLDRYEVSVGRYRKFVEAGYGTQAMPPAVGAGARTLNGASNQ